MKMTREIAHAAAWDAGNKHMVKHGRETWNVDDLKEATKTFDKLWSTNILEEGKENGRS